MLQRAQARSHRGVPFEAALRDALVALWILPEEGLPSTSPVLRQAEDQVLGVAHDAQQVVTGVEACMKEALATFEGRMQGVLRQLDAELNGYREVLTEGQHLLEEQMRAMYTITEAGKQVDCTDGRLKRTMQECRRLAP